MIDSCDILQPIHKQQQQLEHRRIINCEYTQIRIQIPNQHDCCYLTINISHA